MPVLSNVGKVITGQVNLRKIYDISPRVSAELAVYPGDPPFAASLVADFSPCSSSRTSAFSCSAHIGAHAECSAHVFPDGATIDEVDLAPFIGRCQVLRVSVARGSLVRPEVITCALTEPRILLATDSYEEREIFDSGFAGCSVELVELLKAHNVCLLGIDTPSVDLAGDLNLSFHRAAFDVGLVIVEGLLLKNIPEGRYELIALPLKLKGVEASPVRAILRELAE